MLRPRALPVGFIPPCLPIKAPKPPTGAAWIHEIKHDGFRVIARKDGPRVRLYSRPGNDLTRQFPLIAEALASCAHAPASSMARLLLATRLGLPGSTACVTTGSMPPSSCTPST